MVQTQVIHVLIKKTSHMVQTQMRNTYKKRPAMVQTQVIHVLIKYTSHGTNTGDTCTYKIDQPWYKHR